MVLDDIEWYWMILYGIGIIFNGIRWTCRVLYGIVWHCKIFNGDNDDDNADDDDEEDDDDDDEVDGQDVGGRVQ